MKTVVITFGRFNPPTSGHELVFNAVNKVAKKNNADFMIFASHSQNAEKDPLPYKVKIKYLQQMFPQYRKNIIQTDARQVLEVSTALHTMGYKNLIMVVGSDRVKEFNSLLNKYNNTKARHGFYNFKNIHIVSAGERDPDSDDVSGMSASKMRSFATENKKESFMKGLPKNFKNGEKLWKDLRRHMGVREAIESLSESDEIVGVKAKESGISYSILKQVYDRGMAAWKKTHRPGTTPHQWAIARVNSFIKGGKTRQTADADLWKNRNESFEDGTDEYRDHCMDMTPGQKTHGHKTLHTFNDFIEQEDEPEAEEIKGIDKGTVE